MYNTAWPKVFLWLAVHGTTSLLEVSTANRKAESRFGSTDIYQKAMFASQLITTSDSGYDTEYEVDLKINLYWIPSQFLKIIFFYFEVRRIKY